MKPIVFTLPGNENWSANLSDCLPAEQGTLQLRRFPDEETCLRITSAVAGRDVIIACTLDRPDTKLVPLYLLASALRAQGAHHIVLLAPYLAYMRQDHIFHEGETVSAAHIARWLSGFLDGVVTVDPHLHRIARLAEIYSVPTRVVHAAPAMGRWIAQAVVHPLLIGPDAESRPWVEATARAIGCPSVILQKVRYGDRDVQVSIPGVQAYLDYSPVLVDDIVSTGYTMLETTKALRVIGFAAPVCVAVHAIFAGTACEQLRQAGVERIVSCDTVAHATNTIALHRELAQATRELLDELSASS